METRIVLTYNNEDYELDIPANLDLNITFQAGDIRKVLTRSASFSKTVSFPGTANNHQAFKNSFDVSNVSKFNPNSKSFVKVFSQGELIFSGYLKLDSIKDTNSLIEYNCTLYSDISNLFDDLGNKKLNELDFSEYTHTYNRHSVTGSWETFIYRNGNEMPMKFGEGYVYPHIDFGFGYGTLNSVPTYNVEFFRPALYAKTVVDKIFKSVGYSYNSKFFNSDYFRQQIITQPGTTAYVSDSTLEASKVKATGSQKLLLPYYENDHIQTYHKITWGLMEDTCSFTDDYSTGNYDNGGNFDIVTSEYTVPVSGLYKLSTDVFLNTSVDFQELSSGDTFNSGTDMHVKGKLIYQAQICIKRNGVEVRPGNLGLSSESEIDDHWHKNGDFINADDIELVINEDNVQLEAGDKIYVKAGVSIDKTRFWYPLLPIKKHVIVRTYQMYPCSLEVQLANTPLYPGAVQKFDKFLTEDKCKDFLLSIAKMYNLYFSIDSDNPKVLNIEPRTEFYNGNVLDWNYKLDRKAEKEITPVSELEANKIRLTYKEDSDYFNSEYQKKYQDEVYSEYLYEADNNDFLPKDSEEKLDVLFAPAPLSYERSKRVATDFLLTSIYNKDTDTGAVTFNNKSKMRILFYKGLVGCRNYYLREGYLSESVPGTIQTLSSYAYAGMLDNPITPADSLEFGFPKAYFYNREAITNSTIFYKWWYKFLLDSFNSENKLLSGYFYLTANDIANLNFRNIIYLDSRYWVINKVIDYNPVSNTKTKVELLMLVNYEKTSTNIDAYQQTINLNSGTRRLGRAEVGIYNTSDIPYINTNSTIRGLNNNIAVTAVNSGMFGDANKLGAQSNSVAVFGDGNNVFGGSSAVMLVGNENSPSRALQSALVVGNSLSGNLLSNGINTSLINLVPDVNGNPGQIYLNGVPQTVTSNSAVTTGTTSYNFSGFTQLDGESSFVSIIDGYVTGYAPATYNTYGAKFYGVFKVISGGTSGARVTQLKRADITEKTDFTDATCDLITDGVDIFLSVTGEGGEIINWNVQYKQMIN